MSDKEKKPAVRFSERTRIKQVFNKKGKLEAEWSERTLIVPAGSLKAKQLDAVKKLQELCDGLKISGVFANAMARIVMNWKKPENRKKLKVFVVTAKNDLLFKRTFETEREQLAVAASLLKAADRLGIDDEGKSKLAEEIRGGYFGISRRFPKEFLTLPPAFRNIRLPKQCLRNWYAAYLDKPDWMLEEVSDETIKEFFDAKLMEAARL